MNLHDIDPISPALAFYRLRFPSSQIRENGQFLEIWDIYEGKWTEYANIDTAEARRQRWVDQGSKLDDNGQPLYY